MTAEKHYQGKHGEQYHVRRCDSRSESAQRFRAGLFRDLAGDHRVILDFGCGTGGVLAHIRARRRIGVEINEFAAAEARKVLDGVYASLAEIESDSIDVVISCHALEHVEEPAPILREIFRIARPGGYVRIVVPTEMPILLKHHRAWQPNNPDMHLYSWTPLTLGNLMTVSGFEITEGQLVPNSEGGLLGHIFPTGSKGRYMAAYLKALRSGRFQSCVTGRKPA